MPNDISLGRIELILYIIIIMLVLISVGMLLILKQIDNSTKEIKKFCWGESVVKDNSYPKDDVYIKIN